MPTAPKPITFRARLRKQFILRCVDVPKKISAALGGGAHIPVRGWVEDLEIRSTLTPRGRGLHRLVIHSRVWRALRLDAGDFVTVALLRDEAPEQFPIPEDFQIALTQDDDARAAFLKLTPATRRQVANFVAAAKRPATLEKRIAQILERLRAKRLHS